jgi:flagellar hook-basal body complex protein FliE
MTTRLRLRAMDEVTLDDLLDAIRTKVTVMQWHTNKTRDAEHQFMHYILNACQQVTQRLRTAEALLQAFVEYLQSQDIKDPTLNRLVTEAIDLLTSPPTDRQRV